MDCLGRGFRDKDIADQLGISLHTVRTHLRAVMLKAGAKTRAHLMGIAIEAGFEFGPPVSDGFPDRDLVVTVSPRLRFEVLNRDGFKCIYCGACPPATKLHVDHRVPRAGGGDTVIENLVTSCERCNIGKGAHLVTFSEQT